MKKYILSAIIGLTLFSQANQTQAAEEEAKVNTSHECVHEVKTYCNNYLTKHLEANQATLFYMHTDEYGGLTFLDPLFEEYNIIYVEDEYAEDLGINLDELYVGKRYTGTFSDNQLVDLVGMQEYFIRKKPTKELTFAGL